MALVNCILEIPKCPNDNKYTITKFLAINIKGEELCTIGTFHYCSNCDSYLSNNGIEKDTKKIALEFLNSIGNKKRYELSDLIEIKEF